MVRTALPLTAESCVMHERVAGQASNRRFRLAYHYVRVLVVLDGSTRLDRQAAARFSHQPHAASFTIHHTPATGQLAQLGMTFLVLWPAENQGGQGRRP